MVDESANVQSPHDDDFKFKHIHATTMYCLFDCLILISELAVFLSFASKLEWGSKLKRLTSDQTCVIRPKEQKTLLQTYALLIQGYQHRFYFHR